MLESAAKENEPPLLGIDFVFEMGIKEIEEQLREMDALNLKIAVLYGFLGTVLVALLALTFAAAEKRIAETSVGWQGLGLLLVGTGLTGVAIFNAFQAFRVRQHEGIPRFEDLFRWTNDDPKRIRYAFLNTLLRAVAGNKTRLADKLAYANRATLFALLAFLSFLFAIIAVGVRTFSGL